MHCLGLFSIYYKIVFSLVLPFAELNMSFSMNVLPICILYCDAGFGCLIRTVYKYRILILIMDNIFFPVRYSSRVEGRGSREVKKV